MAYAKEDPWACTMLGLVLSEGIGMTKDVSGTDRALDKACEVSVDKAGPACARAKELKELLRKLGKIN